MSKSLHIKPDRMSVATMKYAGLKFNRAILKTCIQWLEFKLSQRFLSSTNENFPFILFIYLFILKENLPLKDLKNFIRYLK